jgi:hypothetical protein
LLVSIKNVPFFLTTGLMALNLLLTIATINYKSSKIRKEACVFTCVMMHRFRIFSSFSLSNDASNVVVKLLTLLFRIREVPGLNPGPVIGYPD